MVAFDNGEAIERLCVEARASDIPPDISPEQALERPANAPPNRRLQSSLKPLRIPMRMKNTSLLHKMKIMRKVIMLLVMAWKM
jgi:hypothetical protein